VSVGVRVTDLKREWGYFVALKSTRRLLAGRKPKSQFFLIVKDKVSELDTGI
jgi:hypothetical protein